MTSTSIFKDRLTKQRRDILTGLGNNDKVDGETRIAAHNLVAEIDKAIYQLSFETPAVVARDLSFINRTTKVVRMLVEKQGLDLRIPIEWNAHSYLADDHQPRGQQPQLPPLTQPQQPQSQQLQQ